MHGQVSHTIIVSHEGSAKEEEEEGAKEVMPQQVQQQNGNAVMPNQAMRQKQQPAPQTIIYPPTLHL